MKMNQIENIVNNYIVRHNMWKHDGLYIVALSGGADSVALLLILKSIGMPIEAAHCNFHLRGEESDRDEQFCVNLCEREGIALHRIHFDTFTYAEKHKISIEMAARDLRYRYFAQLAKDIEADGICVAHHRDDNVETLLLNLLRGSGVDGLAAIAPKNGNILRPLLCISRQDVLDYLAERNQDYVTDSTNLEDDALRNKIRHHVIPLLETLNPAAKDNIAQSAKYLRQAKLMLDNMEKDFEHHGYDIEQTENDIKQSETGDDSKVIFIGKAPIMKAASQEFMLHKCIGNYGFHGDIIDNIIVSLRNPDGGVGKVWKSNDYMLAIDREQLLITPLNTLENLLKEREFRLPEEGNYTLGGNTKIRIRRYQRTNDFAPSKEHHRITLDANKVSFPLTYRLAAQGDRFQPFGMKGTKLISDYLTDRKRNYMEKMSQHVLTDRKGEIIWLIGERTSDGSKITPQTESILEIELVKNADAR